MSTSVKSLSQGADDISCEPVGTLKQQGWLPGTWVKFSATKPSFSPGSIATCDKCTNTDWGIGFMPIGSMYLSGNFDVNFANDNERTIWTPDETVQWSKSDGNSEITFDNNHQLSSMGSGITKVVINNTGSHKFYVYEKYNKAYRDTAGVSGIILDYEATIGLTPKLYVSDRGLLTCEKEDSNSYVVAYILASVGRDDVGSFLVIVSS